MENKVSKHYVYKIINLKNNKIYIGVRTHPNPFIDDYMGSSTIVQNIIEIEGIENFKKEIIKIFETREEAENYEGTFLTEEFCNNPNTYNINRTGIFANNKHSFRKDLWYDYYNEIRKQYNNGKTLKELGTKYKCDRGTIKHICSDILRTISESQQLRFKKDITSGARDLEFDKNNIEELIKLYQIDKWSVKRISNKFNKSAPFITKRLLEANINIRSRKENNEKIKNKSRQDVWDNFEKIIELYNQGYTTPKIGQIFKSTSTLIREILIKNNIKLRKPNVNSNR